MALVEQFRRITGALPDDWELAQFWFAVEDDSDAERAAAVLSPANPGRRGRVLQFQTGRRGTGVSAERIAGLLRRLDQERIYGRLELAEVLGSDPAAGDTKTTLAAQWDAAVAALPPDWSHALGEVSLSSTDYFEPGALQLSPLNPVRHGTRPVLRFRVAQSSGYGAAPEMAHRCFERLDEAAIRGSVRIVHAVSDVHPAATQGPVWYAGGKVV